MYFFDCSQVLDLLNHVPCGLVFPFISETLQGPLSGGSGIEGT
jgi:hypothetical protein